MAKLQSSVVTRKTKEPLLTTAPDPAEPKTLEREELQLDVQTTRFGERSRDARSVMDVAIFRLSKREKRCNQTIRYDLPDGFVEVSSGPAGMATIWDYDIVIMAVSHLTKAMNSYRSGHGVKPGRLFRPSVSSILRGDGGRQYEELEWALDRLKTTTVKIKRTMKERNGRRLLDISAEGLISSYRILQRNDERRVVAVEIELPNLLYNEIVQRETPAVLTVHSDYLRLQSGIARFVYRLARLRAGKNDCTWTFRKLYERSGSQGDFKKFTFRLRELIKDDDLPEYSLAEVAGETGPMLIMKNRKTTVG
ncbi:MULTISPECIES: replication initiator protein A [Pseudomonas]|uniref:replication initiator protein A n=1 Tax=Pseudomonas sp. MIL9 TaxID=2807620 RepID=UPI0019505FA9|nr:replication initiator protein A [Pseudomonas sp. MIL9]MBM6448025.1 replication initiator protein A [Pseudomonas sp. MIL9]